MQYVSNAKKFTLSGANNERNHRNGYEPYCCKIGPHAGVQEVRRDRRKKQ